MFKIFRKIKNRLLRIAMIVVLIVFVFVAVVIAFISPIAKYMIENYSKKFIGRQVHLSWIYVNPFTGYISAHNVRMLEKNSNLVCLTADDLAIDFTFRALFQKTLDINSLKANHLWVNIIQNKDSLNFNDLIKTDTLKPKKNPHFCIRNIHISNSEFHYTEVSIPVSYYFKQINLADPVFAWNVDTTQIQYDFVSGVGSGAVKGVFMLNTQNSDYKLSTIVSNFDLKIFQQYMKDFANYGYISAFLDANIKATGNLRSKYALKAAGNVAVNNFHFGASQGNDYVRFNKFSFTIDSLSPSHAKYYFSNILLDAPYLKYEKYDTLDNFARIFGKKGSNVKAARAQHAQVNIIFLISDYIRDLAKELQGSNYHFDNFKVTNASLEYHDYSLLQEFDLNANPIMITAKNIDTRNKQMDFNLDAKMEPFGNVKASWSVNPNDFGNFNLTFDFTGFPLPLFNPFSISASSYPFHKGTVELHGNWVVINKQVTSDNHLLIINPQTADKVNNEGAKKIPVPLLMAFIRNIDRRIDVNIPITGDLKNPKYHLNDIIWEVIKNIFVKPPTFPFREADAVQKQKSEDFILMEWNLMQTEIDRTQQNSTLR